MTAGANWAGNRRYRAREVLSPRDLEELRAAMAGAPRVRLLGTRHSFNDLADCDGVLVSLAEMPPVLQIDEQARAVRVSGAMRYGDLSLALQREGWALHNLASLAHISVAGTITTGTHGSGDRNGSLATAVRHLRILTPAGELVDLQRGDPDFDGAVVSLGALGAVVEVTLDIEPAYAVRQRVFAGVPWEAVTERFNEITSSAYSVSLFTLWDEPAVSQAWVKERLDEPSRVGPDFFGAAALTHQTHMIAGMDVRNATEQLGVAGPWNERLAHFRFEFTPSSGAEIQTEYLVPRARAVEAIEAVRVLGPRIRELLHITEIRTVAADRLWLSMAYEADVVGLHFTWKRDQERVEALLPDVEAALLPFGPRPHWGKVFLDRSGIVPSLYPRLGDFRDLADRFDPQHTLRNPFLERLLG